MQECCQPRTKYPPLGPPVMKSSLPIRSGSLFIKSGKNSEHLGSYPSMNLEGKMAAVKLAKLLSYSAVIFSFRELFV